MDVHAHCAVPAVLDLVSGTAAGATPRASQLDGRLGFPRRSRTRVADMNQDGIDVQVLEHQRLLVRRGPRPGAAHLRHCRVSNSPRCADSRRGRFLGYAPVSLQFPELAAEQLEHGMTAVRAGRRRHRRQRRGRGARRAALRSVLEESRGAASAGVHPSANRAAIDRHRQAGPRQRRTRQRDRQSRWKPRSPSLT